MNRRTFVEILTAGISAAAIPLGLGHRHDLDFEDRLVNHIFRGEELVMPNSLDLALYGADPDEHPLSEASYIGYHRVSVPRNAAMWDVTENLATLKIPVSFPPVYGNSVEITHVAVYMRKQILMHGPLEHSLIPRFGSAPRIDKLHFGFSEA